MIVNIHLYDTLGQCRSYKPIQTNGKRMLLGDFATEEDGEMHLCLVVYDDLVQLSPAHADTSLLINSVLDLTVQDKNSPIHLHLNELPYFVLDTIPFEEKANLYEKLLKDINPKYRIVLV